jgi:hypothetical protein
MAAVAPAAAAAAAAAPPPPSPSSHAWLVGVAVNLVGSVSINLGTNLMKLGHNRRAALVLAEARAKQKAGNFASSPAAATASAEASVPPASTQHAWRAGVLLFALGNAANFASFAFAAQSLLAAIGSVQFVSNAVFARVVLGEKVGRAAVAATAVIVAGCSLLVACGSHVSRSYTVPQLVACYTDPAYVAYVVVGAVVGVACFLGYRRGRAFVERAKAVAGGAGGGAGTTSKAAAATTPTTTTIDQEDVVLLGDPRLLDGSGVLGGVLGGLFGGSSSSSSALATAAGAAGGKRAPPSSPSSSTTKRGPLFFFPLLFSRLVATLRRPLSPELVASLLPALYATFSALVGTQSVLFSKTLAVTLRALFGGGGNDGDTPQEDDTSAWGGPQYLPFLVAVPLLFFAAAAFWVARLNQGLRLFPGAVVVPAMQVAWTLLSVLSGMLHFGEYRDLSPKAAAGFAVGVATVLAGVVLLSRAAAAAAAGGGARSAGPSLTPSPSPTSSRPATPRVPGPVMSPNADGNSRNVYAVSEEAVTLKLNKALGGGGGGGAPSASAGGLIAALRPGGGASARNDDSSRQLLLGGGGSGSGGGAALSTAPNSGGGGGSSGGGSGGGSVAAVAWLRRAAGDFATLERGSAARLALGLGDSHFPAFSVFMPPMLFAAGAAAVEEQEFGVSVEDGGEGGGEGAEAATAPLPPPLAPLASGAELSR